MSDVQHADRLCIPARDGELIEPTAIRNGTRLRIVTGDGERIVDVTDVQPDEHGGLHLTVVDVDQVEP